MRLVFEPNFNNSIVIFKKKRHDKWASYFLWLKRKAKENK